MSTIISGFKYKKYIIAINLILLTLILILGHYILKTTQSKIIQGENSISDYSKIFINKCSSVSDWRTCYGVEFSNFVRTHEIDSTLSLLNTIEDLDPKTRDCHILAHYISSAVVKKDPKDWKVLLSKVNIIACNYGFIHGSIEGLSLYDKSFEITPMNIPNICKQISQIRKNNNSDQGCAHIMGHILLAEKCDESIDTGIKKTVGECSLLPQTLQHECFAGVFMESFTRDNLVAECNTEHVAWATDYFASQQELVCRQYTGNTASSCWQEISHIYNALYPNQPDKVFEACNRAPNRTDMVYCYQHAVQSLALYQNADRMYYSSLCSPFTNVPNYKACYKNVVTSLITASIKLEAKAIDFCNSINPKYQNDCIQDLRKNIN
ncbi:MAG TPA: hypothetical protein VG917_01270 [Patescibacteria group bacterium]|nr:hypothetical protein [Patescibacteria group bacterium]